MKSPTSRPSGMKMVADRATSAGWDCRGIVLREHLDKWQDEYRLGSMPGVMEISVWIMKDNL